MGRVSTITAWAETEEELEMDKASASTARGATTVALRRRAWYGKAKEWFQLENNYSTMDAR